MEQTTNSIRKDTKFSDHQSNVTGLRKLPNLSVVNQRSSQSADVHVYHQLPDGRFSVDSAYYENASIDDVDERSSVSHVPGHRTPGTGRLSPAVHNKRWMVVVDLIREKRHKAAAENKIKTRELDLLKSKLDQLQIKSRSLESEVEPLKGKLKRYEVLVEELEEKIQSCEQELIKKEKSCSRQVLEIEKQSQEEKKLTELKELHEENEAKENMRHLKIENDVLRKENTELNDLLGSVPSGSGSGEDAKMKQIANIRTELLNVRQILDSSERDRLKERKEKLSTIQNMIHLTKQKSDLEEELDERKKCDTKEGSPEYTRLFEKYEDASNKLKTLHQQNAIEKAEFEKKHLEKIHTLQCQYERNIRDIEAKRSSIQQILDEINAEKINAEKLEKELEIVQEIPEIISSLEEDGVYKPGETGKQLLASLFTQYKNLYQRVQMSDTTSSGGKSIVEALKDEKRQLKRKVEDLQNALEEKEGDLLITEKSLKKQIANLLDERKKTYLEIQKTLEDSDTFKEEVQKLQEQLQHSKETASKKDAELAMLNENLTSVTNEMKTIDADLGKTKRELASKEAEIIRLKQDLLNEQEMKALEISELTKLKEEIEVKRKSSRKMEKKNCVSEEKILHLEELVAASKLYIERISLDKDALQDEMMKLKSENMSKIAELPQLHELIQSSKKQYAALEEEHNAKIESLSGTLLEIDQVNTELLATQHLLREEENKTSEHEQDLEQLILELENKGNQLLALEQENEDLRRQLRRMKGDYEDIEVEYQGTESSLRDHSSMKTAIEKELSLLKMTYNELLKEKQCFAQALEKSKHAQQTDQENIQDLRQKCSELKKETVGNSSRIKEASLETEKLRRENDYLRQECDDLKSGMSDGASSGISFKNQCTLLQKQLNNLSNENKELIAEIAMLKQDNEVEKAHQLEEISDLQKENLLLKKEARKRSQLSADIEEPLQEALVENNVESANFSFLFEDEPTGKSSRKVNPPGRIGQNVVSEDLQEMVDDLLVESQPHKMKVEPNKSLEEVELEKDRLWNDSLKKDNEIKELQHQLGTKESEKECLEQQISSLEQKVLQHPQTAKEPFNEEVEHLKEELCREQEQKNEAVGCLKALICDHEELTTCLKDQQRTLALQRKENRELHRTLNETLEHLAEQQNSFDETRVKLRDVMQSSVSRESNVTIKQKQEIERLKNDFELIREEKRKLQLDCDDKSYELAKTRDDLSTLRNAVEYNLGSMEAEKRAKDLVEEQLKLLVQDRGSTLQKLQSQELMSKMLQTKLSDLQKWHNDLEINLLKSRDFDPLPLDLIKSNQKSREDFIVNQLKVVNNKLHENDTRDRNNKNLFYSLHQGLNKTS